MCLDIIVEGLSRKISNSTTEEVFRPSVSSVAVLLTYGGREVAVCLFYGRTVHKSVWW